MQTSLERYVEDSAKKILFSLVKEGKLNVADAAKAVGMSLQSFERDMKEAEIL